MHGLILGALRWAGSTYSGNYVCNLKLAGCVPVWSLTTDDFRNREDCLPIRRQMTRRGSDIIRDFKFFKFGYRHL